MYFIVIMFMYLYCYVCYVLCSLCHCVLLCTVCVRVSTQLQLTNMYHIISYHIISYHIISYHIISYHNLRSHMFQHFPVTVRHFTTNTFLKLQGLKIQFITSIRFTSSFYKLTDCNCSNYNFIGLLKL
jgi:hypothetical protein